MSEFIPKTTVEKYFAAISEIPRPSEQEHAVSDYVVSVAKKFGLDFVQDTLWNVIVWKPAFPGRESEPPIMLQAHMDMVTVRAPGSDHNFNKDPLKLFVDEGGNLRAENTTLGADDGYGCAYLLAAMEEEFSHPPLECVFTVQEENGCYGAQGLDTSRLKSRRMIGLDTMGEPIEHTCCVSCYCSDRLTVTANLELSRDNAESMVIVLRGVQPVRTGALVHPEQGNAIKIMTRLLKKLPVPFRLVDLWGGEAENYNPVKCTARISIPVGTDYKMIEKYLNDTLKNINAEINDGTQQMSLQLSWNGTPRKISISQKLSDRILTFLDLLPSQTFAISPKDGRMIATNNIGVLNVNKFDFQLVMSDRARDEACLDGINRRVQELCDLCGFDLKIENRYMPWRYNPDSVLLKETAALMKEKLGHEMVETICPGGLELCDFLPKIPELDCVMFAPIGGECHSTSEWMNLESFNHMYGFLKDLLARI